MERPIVVAYLSVVFIERKAQMSTQQPLQSGWTDRTSASEVLNGIDLEGKLAVVTGGYSSIGLEAVRALAAGVRPYAINGESAARLWQVSADRNGTNAFG